MTAYKERLQHAAFLGVDPVRAFEGVIASQCFHRCRVLADAGYGLSAPFRQGLTARKLTWAVGIPRHPKVYPADVRMIWPGARPGGPRQRPVPALPPLPT